MKKKIINVLLIVALLGSALTIFAGCGNKNNNDEKSNSRLNESNKSVEDEKDVEDIKSNEIIDETIQEGNSYKVKELDDSTNTKFYILNKEGSTFTSWEDYKNNSGNFTVLDNMKPSDIDSMWNETGYIGFYDVGSKQYAIVYWIENSQKPYRAYIFTEQDGTIVNTRITSEIYIDDIFKTSDNEKHAQVSYAPDISGSWEGRTGDDLVKINIYTEGTKKMFTLDYYPDNNNHFTEELTGEWNTNGFEISTGLALYEISDITVDNNIMTFSVKAKTIIVPEAKNIIIKDGTYKVEKNG